MTLTAKQAQVMQSALYRAIHWTHDSLDELKGRDCGSPRESRQVAAERRLLARYERLLTRLQKGSV